MSEQRVSEEANPDPHGTYWLSENDGSVYRDGADGPVSVDESDVVRLLNETEIERDVTQAALNRAHARIAELEAPLLRVAELISDDTWWEAVDHDAIDSDTVREALRETFGTTALAALREKIGGEDG